MQRGQRYSLRPITGTSLGTAVNGSSGLMPVPSQEKGGDKLMPYAIKVALQSLWHQRWINLLSILTIAMGLLVVTLIVLFMYNLDLFTKRLPERFSVVAYLKEGISEQDTQEIIASIKKHRGVEKVTYISKAEALRELKASMKSADYILEGLNENPLPASIEIRLKREVVGPESVKSFVSDIREIPGMEDIQYGEKFLLSLYSLKKGVQTIGLVLSVVMTAGVIFICYSTVKILFYRRTIPCGGRGYRCSRGWHQPPHHSRLLCHRVYAVDCDGPSFRCRGIPSAGPRVLTGCRPFPRDRRCIHSNREDKVLELPSSITMAI